LRKELGDDTYLFSLPDDVEYLNQSYKLQISESDSYGDPLGGFIVDFTKDTFRSKGEGYYDRNLILCNRRSQANKKIELRK
jgi:hypothetical protein